MYLFSLLNQWIRRSYLKMKTRMRMMTVTAIPLTPQVGLTSWVDDCSTLYQIVKEYRTRHDVEPEFGGFDAALAASDGKELRRILLAGAIDSEDWLDRRVNYSLSLALTSVVGYAIGLGGRDPSHIMMHRQTAHLVHTGLRHCFDVARHKNIYPELVPFRLTRMLVMALEVTGVEGTFSTCAEDVLAMLREMANDILPFLDVFVEDPLLPWAELADGNDKFAVHRDFMLVAIKRKLTAAGTVAENIRTLIAEAMAPERLAKMNPEWMPWW
jgi:FKBP12-rapamycin complex-associated protein